VNELVQKLNNKLR